MSLDLLQSKVIAISETATGENICDIDIKAYSLLDPFMVSGFFSPDNNMVAVYNHLSWKAEHPLKLFIAKLLTQKDQDTLEKLKKLPLFELLKITAIKKEQRKPEQIEKEQQYVSKAVELNIFSLLKRVDQSIANIRAKIYSWWNSWIKKSVPQ